MNADLLKRLSADLEYTWHTEIPLSKAMDLRVNAFDGETLTVQAALEPNINVHGTAFAGSLYAINALCGWGTMHLQLALRDINGAIVIANGNIHYGKPVQETIVATCTFGAHEASWQKLQATGRARFELHCTITSKGAPAAEFTGEYAVKLAR